MSLTLAATSHAQTTYTDNFTTHVNYLTNGVSGTIWDGVYFGAGDFANTSLGGDGAGATTKADAGITAVSTLSLQTTATDWENTADDGFFLYKVVKGNFSASVHIVTPYNNSGYNTAGLQARAFSANGSAFGGSENFVSLTRFNEYGFNNYLRNEVNGGVNQIDPDTASHNSSRVVPSNTNYWVRIDRVGNVFSFYERDSASHAWWHITNSSSITRSDLSGQPVEIGIMHATFGGSLPVQFQSFSLVESNAGPFATTPGAPTGLTLTNLGAGNISASWTPGSGSAGSVVVVWASTNSVLNQLPVNGTAYAGNSVYGQGDTLPGAGYYVVYSGSGSQATISGLPANSSFSAAVFSYAGSGSSLSYNTTQPASGVITVGAITIVATETVAPPDVSISFTANPGKWYWLQYSDSLNPANWQNVVPGPVLANNVGMVIQHVNGAMADQRYYRLQQVDPEFSIKTSAGAITSLQRFDDAFTTEYISGGRFGDAIIRYRPAGNGAWTTARTANLSGISSSSFTNSPDGTEYISTYNITAGLTGGPLVLQTVFTFGQDNLLWSVNVTNLSSQSVEIGDLALPMTMNDEYSGVTSSTMKHSFVSGYGSFLFWMRPDSVGPYLLMTPNDNTKLEYWDNSSGTSAANGYEVFIHSKVSGGIAATNYPTVTTKGGAWRQTNTSLTLGSTGSQTYGFKFQWPNSYDEIRQDLVNEGKIDVHVVPGMTVPTNLFAQIALNTTQTVNSVTAEHPTATQIQYLGTTNVSTNTYQLYQIQFSQLGENMLTINYGAGRTMYLEFFVTEPLETLIKKRAAYLVSHQILTNTWYSGLFCDINVNDEVLVTPDRHDTLGNSFQVYEIASDDAGESRPAYLGEKEAVFPVQSEVSALDYYITNFVWGGLQRATNESFSYGIYGVPDWHTLRTNGTSLASALGRGYDYPHIITMYYGMYRLAKQQPQISTALQPIDYLMRAWGTATAMWTNGGGQATQVGLMNEMVIPGLLDDLVAEGLTNQANVLRKFWEAKVNYYVTGHADLFASEYAFDATGFESQEAYAKYALQHAGSSLAMGSTNVSLFLQQVYQYAQTQINANIFDRGWLETAYYYYGSDYRGDMGDDFVVTYMAQMGGWGLLDYAMTFPTNNPDYLRLGYASYLCGWSTINSGPASANYGYWYPGAQNDGACGGGFEPAANHVTWLGGQPMHRGAWYYSAEENLGYCGAIREAATFLSDDPIFGRFCYGGTWTNAVDGIEVTPLDGVRKRFHAILNNGNLHVAIDSDRFVSTQPIVLKADLTQISFTLETDNPAAHTARLHLTASTGGSYAISNGSGTLTTLTLTAGQESTYDLPIPASSTTATFTITEQ